jgi:hypothetical protein
MSEIQPAAYVGFGLMGIGALLIAWLVVHALRRRRELAHGWRIGLALGAVSAASSLAAVASGLIESPLSSPALAATLIWEVVRCGACAAVAQSAVASFGGGLRWLDARVVRPDRRAGLAATSAVAAGAIAWTAVLFRLTGARPSALMAELAATAAGNPIVPLVQAAFAEEITWRLGAMSLLAIRFARLRHGGGLAIAIAAGFWTASHLGATDPWWVKPAQIFPIGLAFGWLARRHGVEASFVAHALMNLAMIVPGTVPEAALLD